MATPKQKAGDTLILAGTLGGDNMPTPEQWVGAVPRINVRLKTDNSLVLDHVAVSSFDPDTLEFTYHGEPLTILGEYLWEVEVEFNVSDLEKLTWPNGGNLKFLLVDQLA